LRQHTSARAVAIGSPLGLAVKWPATPSCACALVLRLADLARAPGVARASYVPDMLKTPPADVLESAAAHVAERARVIEVMGEGS